MYSGWRASLLNSFQDLFQVHRSHKERLLGIATIPHTDWDDSTITTGFGLPWPSSGERHQLPTSLFTGGQTRLQSTHTPPTNLRANALTQHYTLS